MKRERPIKMLGYDHLHVRQIPTKKQAIKNALYLAEYKVRSALINVFTFKKGSYAQKNSIVVAAAFFERVSCLVYGQKDGRYHKLPEKDYRIELFDYWAETPEEVLQQLGKGYKIEDAEHIHKLIRQVADLVCPMMACGQQAFVSDYAYAIEYVVRNDGDLPKPEIKYMFPLNYKNYYSNEGIAEEIEGYS